MSNAKADPPIISTLSLSNIIISSSAWMASRTRNQSVRGFIYGASKLKDELYTISLRLQEIYVIMPQILFIPLFKGLKKFNG
tara:strand:+ start:182 stop:427 length:246 start_codon:yes stop_codon:yes gene_type:complete